jgi:thiamine-phosphate diphosphorylase
MSVSARATLGERLRCYLVTDPGADSVERLVGICRKAIEGGVTAVQLRVKDWTDRETLAAALALRSLCDETRTLFLVNDRADIALAARADGVHLGVDDLPVAVARELLGPQAVIGYSPEGIMDARNAVAGGVDYLGVGPVYGTATKADAGPALGLDRFAEVVGAVDVPVIGIGGVDRANARALVDAGAVGVAVVSAVFYALDPAEAARAIIEAMP